MLLPSISQSRLRLACIALLTLPFSTQAARQVTLAWDASPDPTVAGYNVRYGSVTGEYTSTINVGKTTTATVSNLGMGEDFHFVVTAYKPGPVESVPSNEVVYSSPELISPTVQITRPGSGAELNGPASVSIEAQAIDPDGVLSKVEFYEGSKKIAETSSSPYSAISSNLPAGQYSFSAVGVDKSGGRWPSAPVPLRIVRLKSSEPKLLPDGSIELTVDGASGSTSRVWYSSDLKNWTILSTVENTGDPVTIQDPNAKTVARRFYKITSP